MSRRAAEAAEEPCFGPTLRRPPSPRPATRRQPRVVSRFPASGAPLGLHSVSGSATQAALRPHYKPPDKEAVDSERAPVVRRPFHLYRRHIDALTSPFQ